jgi:hypothetical protein
MTTALQNALNDIYDAKVPMTWAMTPGGDEFSWISPTLGLWFTILLERDSQNRTWLQRNRPSSFWMTGFFNPQGFLTSMKQEVARAHRSEQWALDDMEYVTTVTEHEHLNALGKKGPDEGRWSVVGGRWSVVDGCGSVDVWSRSDGLIFLVHLFCACLVFGVLCLCLVLLAVPQVPMCMGCLSMVRGGKTRKTKPTVVWWKQSRKCCLRHCRCCMCRPVQELKNPKIRRMVRTAHSWHRVTNTPPGRIVITSSW